MINWDEFEHIHVIKKLKEILSTWWNVDLVFTDEKGQVRGFQEAKSKLVNPAVASILEKEAAKESLADLVAKALDDLRVSENKFSMRKWDAAGFDVAIFPIMIENDFMGTVVALGFLKDPGDGNRLSEIRERMAAFGISGPLAHGLKRLFMTHPPLEERIAALQAGAA